ncbi:MAG TPA: hemolysin expression modulating protein [Planctomycetaceae bacterium]|nr:hemolysin expression modulating protein [Planctomycetaceae bacterium]
MTSTRKNPCDRPNRLPGHLTLAFTCVLGIVLSTDTGNKVTAGPRLANRNPVAKAPSEKFRRRQLEQLRKRMQSQVVRGTGKADHIITYNGDDRIIAGGGDDVISSGGGDDFVSGGDDNDRIYGGSGDDFLQGDRGNDVLMGGSGNDVLKGEQGNDFLHGGDGDDELHTRTGNDYLVGGTGDDTFVVRPSGQPEINVILDFTPGEDVIDLTHPGIHVVDFADLLSLAYQTPQGVRIVLPTNNSVGDRLLLIGITIADLDPADFDI